MIDFTEHALEQSCAKCGFKGPQNVTFKEDPVSASRPGSLQVSCARCVYRIRQYAPVAPEVET